MLEIILSAVPGARPHGHYVARQGNGQLTSQIFPLAEQNEALADFLQALVKRGFTSSCLVILGPNKTTLGDLLQR